MCRLISLHLVALFALLLHAALAHPVSSIKKAKNQKHHQPQSPLLPDLYDTQELPIKHANRQSSQAGVSINTGGDGFANAYGSEVHVITDAEIASFGLGDENLKVGVEKYKGRRPNDAFVRGPTPWDDLYSRYSWTQVTTTVRPISAEVIDKSIEPVIVSSVPFNNTSSQKATFDVSTRQEVRNTVTSSWSSSSSVTFTQTLKYQVEFLGTGGGGETSLSFESSWGQGGEQSQTVVVGFSSGVTVELEPGELVYSTIRASRGTMKVKVGYLATLHGYVAANFNPRFEDHHFWAYDVNGVLRAKELSTEIYVEEILEVGYFFNSYVETSDVPRI